MLPWKGNRMAVLVLLRHGESEWNRENLFAGWANVDLTPAGELEARRAGDLLVENDLLPEVVHTSVLRRAIRTAQIALDVADRDWIPVRRSWRLNERHYGALQGKNRVQVRNEFGDEQFMLWRRSYDTPPPPARDDECNEAGDPRYANLLDTVPRTECQTDQRQSPSCKRMARVTASRSSVVSSPSLRRKRCLLTVAIQEPFRPARVTCSDPHRQAPRGRHL